MTATFTFTQLMVVVAIFIVVAIFVGMWRKPEKTSRALSLTLSALRHILRLRSEVKGEPPREPLPQHDLVRRPVGANLGTISAYLSPAERERIASLTEHEKADA